MMIPLSKLSNDEAIGKKLNIESKKLIKTNKEKQYSYNLIDIELISASKTDGKTEFIH